MFRKQQLILLLGSGAFWLLSVAVIYFGVAPLVPDTAIPESVPAVACVALLMVAWFWARARIPRRQSWVTIDDYWRDGRVATAASLVLFLFEGGATLAVVWTMASASRLSAAVSLAGVVLIAFHGPDRLERPLL